MKTAIEILHHYWKYPAFRSPQEEIITSVLEGNSTVALLPTGAGKSLCYQVPAMILDGICVVVSPLIALMYDQVSSLKNKSIKAIALTSQLTIDETITAFDNLQFGNYKFLYISPEKLQSPLIKEKIKNLNVSLIAIDEAHCISEWGHDFRPSYLLLKNVIEQFPKAKKIALTATATSKVLDDITFQLGFKDFSLFKKSFKRENLHYNVLFTEDIQGRLIQLVSSKLESSIVYTNSRRETKSIAEFLTKNNIKATYYHGGLSSKEKDKAYQSWLMNKTNVMVATNAFGMGIDKPDVRNIIHINTPSSIENYIQETGRAGRDHKKANAVLLTNNSILHNTKQRFSLTECDFSYVKNVLDKLYQFYQISVGELPEELFDFSLQIFCSTYNLPILKTYNAIQLLEKENFIWLNENYKKKATIRFIISHNAIFNYMEKHPYLNEVIQLLLRTYGGIFDNDVVLNDHKIAQTLQIKKDKLHQTLEQLHNDGIIHYQYYKTDSSLKFLVHRDDYVINTVKSRINRQQELKQAKLNSIIDYINNSSVCRVKLLLAYFDEEMDKNCGVCDVCLSKIKTTKSISEEEILTILNSGDLTSFEISQKLNTTEKKLLEILTLMLENDKIRLTSQNKFKRII